MSARSKPRPATSAHPLRKLSAADQRLAERVRKICLALPEANERISHGEPTWFAGKGKVFAMLDGHHHASGYVLSAARSELFNAVVATRVRRGVWDRLLPGEAVMLDGRRSFFRATGIDPTLADRCAALDLHPSGPLWGRGAAPAADEALDVESAVTAREPELCALLEGAGLEHERRSLRLPVRGLQSRAEGDQRVLAFELPRGAFATTVLHEIVQDAWASGDAAGD